jgi:predicted Zn-dependent protease
MNTTRRAAYRADPAYNVLGRLIRAYRSGKRREAQRGLVLLAGQYPNSAPVIGYLAGVYYRFRQLKRASELFRRTTELSPKSELASVGLFHSLWGQGFKQQAFDEMRRFLSLHHSTEYAQLLHDMAVEGQIAPYSRRAKSA